MAVCVVEVYDIVPMTKDHTIGAKCDFVEGKYAWLLRNHRILSEKFPVKGSQGFYTVEMPENIKLIQTGKF